APRYAEMVYYGYWFAPERRMLQAAIDEAARAVTGTARLRLYRGNVRTVGRKAERSLYDPRIVSFDESGGYPQDDATRFIRPNAPPPPLPPLLGPRGPRASRGGGRSGQTPPRGGGEGRT